MGSPAFGLELKPNQESRIDAELTKHGLAGKKGAAANKSTAADGDDDDEDDKDDGTERDRLTDDETRQLAGDSPESYSDWNAGGSDVRQQSVRRLSPQRGMLARAAGGGQRPSSLRAGAGAVIFANRHHKGHGPTSSSSNHSPSKKGGGGGGTAAQMSAGGNSSNNNNNNFGNVGGGGSAGPETGSPVRDDAASSTSTSSQAPPPFLQPGGSVHQIFKKNICGDLFGNNANEEGMLYASRNMKVGGGVGETYKSKSASGQQTADKDKADALLLAGETGKNGSTKTSIFHHDGGYWTDTSDSGESDQEMTREGGAVTTKTEKQRLALTLNNWCLEDSNTEYMLEEGGVETLIALSKLDDRLIKRECAQAFNRLCRLPSNRPRLLSLGLASALISLAYALKSPKRGLDCAQALVSLALVAGAEEALVVEGAVSAFMALMSLGESTVAPVCVQGLFNLTCSTTFYPGIEKVIKAIVNLPFTDRIDPRPLIVKGVLNCTLPFQVRL